MPYGQLGLPTMVATTSGMPVAEREVTFEAGVCTPTATGQAWLEAAPASAHTLTVQDHLDAATTVPLERMAHV